jgi:hypothetical protein
MHPVCFLGVGYRARVRLRGDATACPCWSLQRFPPLAPLPTRATHPVGTTSRTMLRIWRVACSLTRWAVQRVKCPGWWAGCSPGAPCPELRLPCWFAGLPALPFVQHNWQLLCSTRRGAERRILDVKRGLGCKHVRPSRCYHATATASPIPRFLSPAPPPRTSAGSQRSMTSCVLACVCLRSRSRYPGVEVWGRLRPPLLCAPTAAAPSYVWGRQL